MALVVQKYGGSSVGDAERIKRVAERIVEARRKATTWSSSCRRWVTPPTSCSTSPSRSRRCRRPRELDMLLTAGERISMALLAMAIANLGAEARSLHRFARPASSPTPRTAGPASSTSHRAASAARSTTARSRSSRASRASVQDTKDITTLGRGGSDTTAVALAAALGASVCEIYTDVDGVFTADPRLVRNARKLDEVTYEEMLELAASGAKVLHAALRRVRPALQRPRPCALVVHAGARTLWSVSRRRGGGRGAGHHPRCRARPQRGQGHRGRLPGQARARPLRCSGRWPTPGSTST